MYLENDYHAVVQVTGDIFPSKTSLFFFQTRKSRKTEFLVKVSLFLMEKAFYEMKVCP